MTLNGALSSPPLQCDETMVGEVLRDEPHQLRVAERRLSLEQSIKHLRALFPCPVHPQHRRTLIKSISGSSSVANMRATGATVRWRRD